MNDALTTLLFAALAIAAMVYVHKKFKMSNLWFACVSIVIALGGIAYYYKSWTIMLVMLLFSVVARVYVMFTKKERRS